jgi:hypothetical protein
VEFDTVFGHSLGRYHSLDTLNGPAITAQS